MRKYVASIVAAVAMLLPSIGRSIEYDGENFLMNSAERRSLPVAFVLAAVKSDAELSQAYLANPWSVLGPLSRYMFYGDELAKFNLLVAAGDIDLYEIYYDASDLGFPALQPVGGDFTEFVQVIKFVLTPSDIGYGCDPWPWPWPWPWPRPVPPIPWPWPWPWPWPPPPPPPWPDCPQCMKYPWWSEPDYIDWQSILDPYVDGPLIDYFLQPYGLPISTYFVRWVDSDPGVLQDFASWISYADDLHGRLGYPSEYSEATALSATAMRNPEWTGVTSRLARDPELLSAVLENSLSPAAASMIFNIPLSEYDAFPLQTLALAAESLANGGGPIGPQEIVDAIRGTLAIQGLSMSFPH